MFLLAGLLVSTLAARASVASGVAVFLWLVFVFLGDLGLMGTSVALRLGARELLFAALVNPLQVFKVGALQILRGGLDLLGPAGLYAARTFGDALLPMLVGALVLWVALPLAAATLALHRRGGLA